MFSGSLKTGVYIFVVALETENTCTFAYVCIYIYNPAGKTKMAHHHTQCQPLVPRFVFLGFFFRWKIWMVRFWQHTTSEGVEFKGSRCELWTRKILASKSLSILAWNLVKGWSTQWVPRYHVSYVGSTPHPATVSNRILTLLVGDAYYFHFPLLLGGAWSIYLQNWVVVERVVPMEWTCGVEAFRFDACDITHEQNHPLLEKPTWLLVTGNRWQQGKCLP